MCAVPCTGEGEAIIRSTVAGDVAAVMECNGRGLQEAIDYVIRLRWDEGKPGLIAVSRFGACATEDGLLPFCFWMVKILCY